MNIGSYNNPTPNLKESSNSPGYSEKIGEIEAKEGLPSADRNNKATLLLTGPFRTSKSSAKDLTPRVSKLQYANHRRPLRDRRDVRLLRYEAGAYSYPSKRAGGITAFWQGFRLRGVQPLSCRW